MNDHLHPVMQAALAPFAPKAYVPSRRTHVTYMGIELAVRYEYQAAEKQTWDEPGWAAVATLFEACVGGVDIYELLSAEQVAAIEQLLVEAA